MLMQNFGVTNKKHYGMLWYFLEWSISISSRRLVKDGMSTGLTNTHTARGCSDMYHMFAWKQCILCSALRHKCCLALLYVTSIRDFLCLWNNGGRLYKAAASQSCVYAGLFVGSQVINVVVVGEG